VFAHLISGQLNKQIGYDLGISERTTKIHRRQVPEKMQADSIADLVRTAADLGTAAIAPWCERGYASDRRSSPDLSDCRGFRVA
jgi:hypothetical protein